MKILNWAVIDSQNKSRAPFLAQDRRSEEIVLSWNLQHKQFEANAGTL